MLWRMLTARFDRKTAPRSQPKTRLQLEELESRLTPSTLPGPTPPPTPIQTGTYTDATVQISPSFFSGTVTETITATVTAAATYNSITGVTTPVPAGAGTPSGTILFNLNNQLQSAQLNSNGQATVSFKMPFLTLFTSQTLEVGYQGNLNNSTASVFYDPSTFLAPLYGNANNLILPSTLTFNQLSPQQVAGTFDAKENLTALPLFNTAKGETESFGPIAFLYSDPGVITQVQAFGFTLPGAFAAQFNAYGSLFSSVGVRVGGGTSSI